MLVESLSWRSILWVFLLRFDGQRRRLCLFLWVLDCSWFRKEVQSNMVGFLAHKDASLCAILRHAEHRILLLKIAVTLTLGILGGAILPVAWGFQATGMVLGFVLMVVVSFANDFTCGLLLRQASVLKAHDYGSLSQAIAGKWYKIFTEISIIILLAGSIISTIQQFGEAGAMGLQVLSSHIPNFLVARAGSVLMVIGVFVIVLPLCLYPNLHQLDKASFLGFVLVWWLILAVFIESIVKRLPAIKNGEFQVVGTPKISSLSQATSIFGYCFFIQPMMMPFLGEVPAGIVGIQIVKWATRLFVLGLAFIMYGVIGYFGAAYYGTEISDNILENKWMGGGVAQGMLNLSITFYLAISIPVLEFPIRQVFISWFLKNENERWKKVVISFLIMIFCLGVSVAFPDNSGSVIVVTGAVGVSIVAYLVPIANHFRLISKRCKLEKEAQRQAEVGNGRSNDFESQSEIENNVQDCFTINRGSKYKLDSLTVSELRVYNLRSKDTLANTLFLATWEYVLPVVVLVIGFFCSAMSLYTL